MLKALVALVAALALVNGALFLVDSALELALGERRKRLFWRGLLSRKDESWLDRLPNHLAKLKVPRPATAAWLLEAVLGSALCIGGMVALWSL
jgi:hypothetical protein